MKLIPLTKCMFTKVDDDDFEKFAIYRWSASKTRHHYRPVREANVDGKKKKVYLYRLIMNAQAGQYIDHINGDTLDNRKKNLRFCTVQENAWNRAGNKHKANSCQYKGVSYNRHLKKWDIRIRHSGRNHYFGVRDTAEEAARAYDALALLFHGKFARLNFPNEHTKSIPKN